MLSVVSTLKIISISARVIILAVISLLSACSSTPSAKDIKGYWRIDAINNGTEIQVTNAWLALNADVEAESGKVQGFSGCNQFFARFKVKENKIAFSPIGSTRKACNKSLNRQEQALFEALTHTLTIDKQNQTLNLLSDEKTGLMLSPKIN